MKNWKALIGVAFILSLASPAVADTTKAELELLNQRVQEQPSNPDARFDLAMGLARTSKLESAWAELQKLNDMDRSYSDKVVSTYEPLVKENASNIEARFRLAFGYYFKNQKDLARQQFEEILKLDPNYVWAYNYMGFFYAEGNDLTKAMEQWNKAIALHPDNAVAHFLMGQAHYRKGQLKEAASELALAMRLRGAN